MFNHPKGCDCVPCKAQREREGAALRAQNKALAQAEAQEEAARQPPRPWRVTLLVMAVATVGAGLLVVVLGLLLPAVDDPAGAEILLVLAPVYAAILHRHGWVKGLALMAAYALSRAVARAFL